MAVSGGVARVIGELVMPGLDRIVGFFQCPGQLVRHVDRTVLPASATERHRQVTSIDADIFGNPA